MTKLWHNVSGQAQVVDSDDYKPVTGETLTQTAQLLGIVPDEDRYPYTPSDMGWLFRGLVAVNSELAKRVIKLEEEIQRQHR